VVRLSEIRNIVGIKEASANFDQIARIISGTRKDFLVWSGNDNDTLPILALGGYGVISVASHLVGKQIKLMIDSFVAGKTEKAAELHRHLLPLFNVCFVVSNPYRSSTRSTRSALRLASRVCPSPSRTKSPPPSSGTP